MSLKTMSSKMNVNKKLLPIKGHYFFFNAGTAPLVPYLSTYARQLGFSASTVGLIYTVLPIFGLIAKPLFGVIADRFQIQKTIFIIFQIVTIVSFFSIYFIPSTGNSLNVELDCNEVTMLRTCFSSSEAVDTCAVDALSSLNSSASCKMNCDMTSPKMWQTVCEHWHIPQYCYSITDNIKYSANLSRIQMKEECAYLTASNVTLDGYQYTPKCRIGQGFVDVNEPCQLNCTGQKLHRPQLGNMTCLDETMNFRVCNDSGLEVLAKEPWSGDECQVSCALEKGAPWRLMEICEGWKADMASTCHPRTEENGHFPTNLSFVGSVPLSSFISEHNCVFARLKHITLPDGSVRYPVCESRAQYQLDTELFQTSCEIECDNAMINELILSSEGQESGGSQYTTEFWLFFLMMIISWIGQAVVVTFADAICFNLLGDKASLYGRQRLWGSVGWGIFSLLTGSLIDLFSGGAFIKDYTVAFALMFALMSVDVIVSWLLKIESTKMSMNILADVGTLLSSLPTLFFFLWTVGVGLCTGLLWNFLFWLLEDVTKAHTIDQCGSDYSKTLQGLVSAIQTFFGEIPFLFVSGYILRKVGHVNMMSLVLFAFGVRFILYSFLTNPWWILPIEMFQGVTFGMFYPTMTSYAHIVAPMGTETTVQGLVGAVFEGVGTSLGSFIGGRLYTSYGGVLTFRWFGYGALVCCALNALAQYLIREKTANLNQGYTAVIRYEQPSDMVYMLEDVYEGKLENHDT